LAAVADSPPDEVDGAVDAASFVWPSVESLGDELGPALDRLLLALERSFLAQPEPLKWTAGVAKAFLSVPSAPQTGQKRGAGASIPWMTSVVCPQFEQP
jgi:hypothetical protein